MDNETSEPMVGCRSAFIPRMTVETAIFVESGGVYDFRARHAKPNNATVMGAAAGWSGCSRGGQVKELKSELSEKAG